MKRTLFVASLIASFILPQAASAATYKVQRVMFCTVTETVEVTADDASQAEQLADASARVVTSAPTDCEIDNVITTKERAQ